MEETIIYRIEIDQEQYIKDIVDVKKQIDTLTQKQKELDTTTQEGAIAYQENAASIRALKAEQTQLSKVIDNSIITRNKEIKSINEARANVKLLTKQRNELDISTETGRKKLEELNGALDKNNKFIKDNVDQYTQQKINIGNYASALQGLGGPLGNFVGKLSNLKDGLEQTKKGIDVSKAGFSGFNGVIKASAIGVLVTLVGGLIAAFTKFEPLMDRLKEYFAAANAVVDVFVERLTRVGRGLVAILDGDPIEGINMIRTAFDDVGQEIVKVTEAARRLSRELDAIDDRQRAQIIINAEVSKQVDQLLLQSKNRALSEKERLALLDQAGKLERANFEQEKKLSQDSYNNYLETVRLKTQLSKEELEELLTNTNRREELEKRIGTVQGEELDKLANMKAAQIQLESETINVEEKIANRRSQLLEKEQAERDKKQKEREAKEKKAADDALKAQQERFKRQQAIFDQTNEYIGQNNQEQLDEIDYLENQKQLKLVEGLIARNVTQQQYDAALLEIKSDSLAAERELLIKLGEDTTAIDLEIAENKLAIQKKSEQDTINITNAILQANVEAAQAVQGVIAEMAALAGSSSQLAKAAALTNVAVNLGTAIANLTATSSAPTLDNIVTGGASGFAKYTVGLAKILTAINQARSLIGGAAAGGGSFRTKGPTMLLVGDNPGGVEEINVKPISGRGKTVVNPKGNLVKMAGGGTMIADGGASANRASSATVAQFNMLEMLKRIPAPELKITELNRVQKNASKAVKVSSLGR
jgi:hypothetical protein